MVLFRGIVVGAFCVAATCWAQAPETFEGCPASAQQALRDAQSQFQLTGIALATSTAGRLTCVGAVGLADTASHRPMKPATMMRIGSISKTITAMAIVKLREQGKLSLDDN